LSGVVAGAAGQELESFLAGDIHAHVVGPGGEVDWWFLLAQEYEVHPGSTGAEVQQVRVPRGEVLGVSYEDVAAGSAEGHL
jgi:hypothetical protein